MNKPTSQTTPEGADALRTAVRIRYAAIANGAPLTETAPDSDSDDGECCCRAGGSRCEEESAPPKADPTPAKSCCCGSADSQAQTLGYTKADLDAVPDGANLGLGCGNPTAIASLCTGETVLDLGSGAGFDAFLAARAVGPTGHVIGVDMTPEMLAKARANARSGGYTQVEFRLGEIEALPVADATVDVIISNCVINLCPDKAPVYREAFRVLRAGGRLAVSDVVAHGELPATVRQDLALHTGCLAGATPRAELEGLLRDAGFTDIVIAPKDNSDAVITSWEAKRGFESLVFAAYVTARKPATAVV